MAGEVPISVYRLLEFIWAQSLLLYYCLSGKDQAFPALSTSTVLTAQLGISKLETNFSIFLCQSSSACSLKSRRMARHGPESQVEAQHHSWHIIPIPFGHGTRDYQLYTLRLISPPYSTATFPVQDFTIPCPPSLLQHPPAHIHVPASVSWRLQPESTLPNLVSSLHLSLFSPKLFDDFLLPWGRGRCIPGSEEPPWLPLISVKTSTLTSFHFLFLLYPHCCI